MKDLTVVSDWRIYFLARTCKPTEPLHFFENYLLQGTIGFPEKKTVCSLEMKRHYAGIREF